MENEVEFRFLAVLADHCVLSLLKNLGTEFHRTGFVSPVHIAEGGGEHIPAEAVKAFVNGEHILGRGVKFFGGRIVAAGRAVFLTSHDAGFDFEDDFIGGA